MQTKPSARERILIAAERLIAEQGPSASLREIAAAAGQRNNSAVSYHFGSREALIEAIIDLRQESLDAARMRRLAELDNADQVDLRSLVEALVRPMFTAPYDEGSTHYARFLEKVRDFAAVQQRPLEGDRWPGTKMLIGRLDRMLADLPPAVRRFRLQAFLSTMLALLADLERAGRRASRVDQGRTIDVLAGLLSAPEGRA